MGRGRKRRSGRRGAPSIRFDDGLDQGSVEDQPGMGADEDDGADEENWQLPEPDDEAGDGEVADSEDDEDEGPEDDEGDDAREDVRPTGISEPDQDYQRLYAEAMERNRLLEERAERATKDLHEVSTKQIDGEIQTTRTALKAAIEDGDTDRQVELQDQLAELRARKAAAPAAVARDEPAAPAVPRIEGHTPDAKRWIQGRHWINHPAYADQNRALLMVAEAVAGDGWDPNGAEYYQEVERRMARRFPDLFVVRKKGTHPKVSPVSRDASPSAQNGSGSRNKRVVLTPDRVANMKKFGLDPHDPAHVKRYLAEATALERSSR